LPSDLGSDAELLDQVGGGLGDQGGEVGIGVGDLLGQHLTAPCQATQGLLRALGRFGQVAGT